LVIGLAACATRDQAPANAATEVDALAQRLDTVIRARDRAALEEIVAPDFDQVLGNGSQVDRATFIAALTASGPDMPFRTDNRRVRIADRTAIVTFTLTYGTEADRSHPPLKAFVVDVYRQDRDSWLLVFEQIGVKRTAG
jgi:ketosteroid isomerase-like protein